MSKQLSFVLFGTLVALGCGSPAASVDAGNTDSAVSTPGIDAGLSPDAATARDGAADAADVPPQKVGDCSSLGAAGVWQDITPPTIKAQTECGNATSCGFGVSSFVLDPSTSGTLYLGTDVLGVWKTPDCGATWTHIDTGTNSKAVDGGNNWTFAIDQTDPQVLYTCSGYGSMGSGAWKSTNGGVDWAQLWPPTDPMYSALKNNFQYNFIGSVSVDPFDHTHLILTFHEGCCTPATCGTANPTYSNVCIAESHHSGADWNLIRGESTWVGEEGQSAWFLDGSSHWLWASSSNGIWQTADDGTTWKVVLSDGESHGGGQLYRVPPSGPYYLAGRTGILTSPDATTWTLIPNSGTNMSGLTGDGTTMWASSGYPFNPGQRPPTYQPFYSAAVSAGQTWTTLPSPSLADGGPLAYDKGHHVLYSSNLYGGFYRVVVP